MGTDQSCVEVALIVHDDKLDGFSCRCSKNCHVDGASEIVWSRSDCHTTRDGGTSIETFKHDTLKFCRKGFCTCMTTHWDGNEPYPGGRTLVKFHYDDDQAWPC